MKVWLALGAVLLAQPALTSHASAESTRAVVELFTSQGCSSCPPADAVLAELSRQPGMIALSFPVDYWDYLGWKDTLAQGAFTARQKGYAKVRSDWQVYTPQMIVNGSQSCVGSDRARIEDSIRTATAGLAALPVNVAATETDGTITVSVNEAAESVTPQKADVWVLPVLRSHMVSINRGENRGRAITYVNVVRAMNRVGEWNGGTAQYKVPVSLARKDADSYVVLLQTADGTRPGAILGATKGPGL
ncbi:DUF1223 domain-containing protein [Microvirga pudoricolor]|uniref:DUF1223 domain-containing protein n=1 Tax=Microvirga pudoricolor TaxID=2778729 RepID=UPI0019516CDB|nr:DUF1223 domain-containing protein [Microvirga pudoricolor]MBM6594053.1 DUF1223 domain-containing protein [Microvirga pudoricolor]